MIHIGEYEVSLVSIGAVFLGLYVNGLFRLIQSRRKADAPKPFSRAARA